ncbi:MAG: hypothetical protein EA397_14595 [Deltaproteobacteria bacterium]|nr:MAG: hypothetical protein EA397_14595 [Deltaproteobacteria bacterium]
MDRDLEQDFSLDIEPLDLGPQEPPPPESRRPPPPQRPGADHLLGRSPWYLIPLLVSLIIGAERVLMLGFLPGWRAFGVTVFGALFVLTFTLVLAAGGMYIERYRRQ